MYMSILYYPNLASAMVHFLNYETIRSLRAHLRIQAAIIHHPIQMVHQIVRPLHGMLIVLGKCLCNADYGHFC